MGRPGWPQAARTFSTWSNRIDGNLQCKSNGTPRTGDGNIVEGDKEDQCRGR